jgi:hypothetical protein
MAKGMSNSREGAHHIERLGQYRRSARRKRKGAHGQPMARGRLNPGLWLRFASSALSVGICGNEVGVRPCALAVCRPSGSCSYPWRRMGATSPA